MRPSESAAQILLVFFLRICKGIRFKRLILNLFFFLPLLWFSFDSSLILEEKLLAKSSKAERSIWWLVITRVRCRISGDRAVNVVSAVSSLHSPIVIW